jgi:Mg2+/citrate symporter
MSYQLILVFVSPLGSVLCVILRMQKFVLISFQRRSLIYVLLIQLLCIKYKRIKHVILQ